MKTHWLRLRLTSSRLSASSALKFAGADADMIELCVVDLIDYCWWGEMLEFATDNKIMIASLDAPRFNRAIPVV
jgi:hypothetical protein